MFLCTAGHVTSDYERGLVCEMRICLEVVEFRLSPKCGGTWGSGVLSGLGGRYR